ncbi:MAG: bile acid:sodium symporter [Pirellulales bacterium]
MFSFTDSVAYWTAATQLVLAMAGMGATLTLEQFREIVRRPHPVGIVLFLQYVIFPGLAALCGWMYSWPPGVAIGLVLMNAVPSGSLTNVFTYLGLGNVTLSIVMTVASTAICFVATPLALEWFAAAELPEGFSMPIKETLYPIIFFLLLPLAGGALVAYYLPQWKQAFSRWIVRASLVPLTMYVVGSLTSGRIDVTEHGLHVPALLIIFIIAAIVLTNELAKLTGFDSSDSFTMAIEVGMRNGNLAFALIETFFPERNPINDGVRFVALFWAGATMIIAGIAVIRRRWRLARKARVEATARRDPGA